MNNQPSSGTPGQPTYLPPQAQPQRPAPILLPGSRPILSYVILAFNVLVFGIDFLSEQALTAWGARDNAAILQGELWRLVTPMFLHAGLIHLGFNSWALYIIGPQVERAFGRMKFAAIYLLAGIGGTIAGFIFSPYRSIGASGALFGLFGALVPLFYRNRTVLVGTQRRLWSIAQVIGINLVIGLVTPSIDNWGHLGGLVSGMALGWFTTPRYVLRFDYITAQGRVEDTASLVMAWAAVAMIGLGLGAIFALQFFMR